MIVSFCATWTTIVSVLTSKKDPDNNKTVNICELNNATHLKYDSDLTTDGNFYYRGSKVSYKSIFGNFRLGII